MNATLGALALEALPLEALLVPLPEAADPVALEELLVELQAAAASAAATTTAAVAPDLRETFI
jgi:hypothetical protein